MGTEHPQHPADGDERREHKAGAASSQSLHAGLLACPLCPHTTHPDPWRVSQHPVPCFGFFYNIPAAPLTVQGCTISLLGGECKQGTTSTAPSWSRCVAGMGGDMDIHRDVLSTFISSSPRQCICSLQACIWCRHAWPCLWLPLTFLNMALATTEVTKTTHQGERGKKIPNPPGNVWKPSLQCGRGAGSAGCEHAVYGPHRDSSMAGTSPVPLCQGSKVMGAFAKRFSSPRCSVGSGPGLAQSWKGMDGALTGPWRPCRAFGIACLPHTSLAPGLGERDIPCHDSRESECADGR